ncbi:MAG: hypothetical protein ACLU4J_24695 [Butyricimonas paravirosa]
MKIIQQPDILSFAGNVNDFVIVDVAKSLVFKLSVDGMVIVDEVYVAEGGEVRVSMKDIVDCFYQYRFHGLIQIILFNL